MLNVQAALRDDVLPKDDPAAFKILSSKEYGASAALDRLLERQPAIQQTLASKAIQAKDSALTLASVLETLKSQRRNEVSVGGASFRQLTEPTPEAQILLDLLARQPGSSA